MSRSKVIAVSIVIIAVFGIAMIDGAVANDKMKWHGTGITVKWEQIEVGDEEGHVIAITQSKQIHP